MHCLLCMHFVTYMYPCCRDFALLIFFPVNTLNTVVIDAVGTATFAKISR